MEKTQQEIEEIAEREYPNRYKEDISYDYNEEAREGFIKGYQAAQEEMKWIKCSEKMPNKDEVGNKVLLYRITNESQELLSISIHDTYSVKFCNPDETWWQPLPQKPLKP